MNKTTVCAVVVTYNRSKLLLECLNALKNQSLLLDAIFIIDNASNDNTPEILMKNKYIHELPRYDSIKPWIKNFIIKNSKNKEIYLHYIRMKE